MAENPDEHPLRDAPPHRRRHYLFALRDPLPLDERGWSVWLHQPECADSDEGGPRCRAPEECHGLWARFEQVPVQDNGMASALARLAELAVRMTGSGTRPGAPPTVPLSSFATMAVVSAPVRADESADDAREHWGESFRLLQQSVGALRIATSARTPSLTIERVWPKYLVLLELEDGTLEVAQLVTVGHALRGVLPPRPATPVELERAAALFAASHDRSPVELYRDYQLSADNAAHVDGDYAEAVLKAAVAAEVLIKHTAATLVWEAVTHGPSPPPAWASDPAGLLGRKPAKLIGSVLVHALGGSWSSQRPDQPVGGWRQHVARQRAAVLHRGHRPDEVEASDAVDALLRLTEHVADRLAAQAQHFPRTAIPWSGRRSWSSGARGARSRRCTPATRRTGCPPTWLGWRTPARRATWTSSPDDKPRRSGRRVVSRPPPGGAGWPWETAARLPRRRPAGRGGGG